MRGHKSAVSLLALFTAEQIFEIASYLGQRSPSTAVREIRQARDEYAPSAVFHMAGPKYCKTDEDAAAMVQGLVALLMDSTKDLGFGAGDYKSVLQGAFGLSDDYALHLAENIDTFDVEKGFLNTGYSWIAKLVNGVAGLWNSSPMDANTDEADTDLPFEVMSLGRVINDKMIPRLRMSSSAASQLLGAPIEDVLEKVIAQQGDLSQAMETGELQRNIASNIYRYGDLGIPAIETGGLFSKLRDGIKKGVAALGKLGDSGVGKILQAVVPGASAIGTAVDMADGLMNDNAAPAPSRPGRQAIKTANPQAAIAGARGVTPSGKTVIHQTITAGDLDPLRQIEMDGQGNVIVHE